MLNAVFDAFDIDGSGWIEAGELLALGKARRITTNRSSEWTEVETLSTLFVLAGSSNTHHPQAKNRKLVDKLDSGGDGRVYREAPRVYT